MSLKNSSFAQRTARYGTPGRCWYCLGFIFIMMSVCALDAKPKKTKAPTITHEKRRCDIIAYHPLCLENPRKLGNYGVFYHKEAHCIGLNINRIFIGNNRDIMCSIFCRKRLKRSAKDKATWPLIKRYYIALKLANNDYASYEDYQNNKGKHRHSVDDILVDILVNTVDRAIQIAKFSGQEALFERMLPYITALSSIKKQVRLSKVNVVMLAIEEPILPELEL